MVSATLTAAKRPISDSSLPSRRRGGVVGNSVERRESARVAMQTIDGYVVYSRTNVSRRFRGGRALGLTVLVAIRASQIPDRRRKPPRCSRPCRRRAPLNPWRPRSWRKPRRDPIPRQAAIWAPSAISRGRWSVFPAESASSRREHPGACSALFPARGAGSGSEALFVDIREPPRARRRRNPGHAGVRLTQIGNQIHRASDRERAHRQGGHHRAVGARWRHAAAKHHERPSGNDAQTRPSHRNIRPWRHH
jgi:hypothetical protein